MSIIFVFIGIALAFLVVVGIVYSVFWLVVKGIDARYDDTDCNVKDYSPGEIKAAKDRIAEHRKHKKEEYRKKNEKTDSSNNDAGV